MKRLSLLPILFLLSACSVYKSQGRKAFESDSSGNLKTYSLVSCKKQNSITAWFQSEFPNKNYELVLTEPDLEIWKGANSDDTVEVRAVQINAAGQIACSYQFANEGAWRSYQKDFIHELENNMMTAD